MKDLLAPVEVSRWLLLGLVACGALVSVASEGTVSNFAGGVAVGSGAVFVASWLKGPRRGAATDEPEDAP